MISKNFYCHEMLECVGSHPLFQHIPAYHEYNKNETMDGGQYGRSKY